MTISRDKVEALIVKLRKRREFLRNGATWVMSVEFDSDCTTAAIALEQLLQERDQIKKARDRGLGIA